MSNKKILAVEDHELLLLAIRDILQAEGYEVVTAVDGVDALEKLQAFTPDLIIADISMPRMDGYRFFEEVHRRPTWVPIPFVFLTARAEQEDRLKGKAMGAEDYLVKPFDPQELLVVVKSRIGRAQAIREASEIEFDELKRRIVTLLSHELRTPLTSVYGYTELALEEAATLPTGDFQQFLVGIKRGADRLTKLVEDLLLVVRLESGELQREFELLGSVEHGLGRIIRNAATAEAGRMANRGVVLELDVPEELPPVAVHEYFLTDALARLIDNAAKFSRSEVKRVRLTARGDSEVVKISVRDWGVGISEGKISYLFETFGQVDRDKQEQQGAGLGLVITEALVTSMGGAIEIESSQGENSGTTVTISLPVAQDA